MSKAVHQFEVRGVDKTAGAFSSVQSRAAAASAKLRKMLGGALAAAGAYLGVRAISRTISRLGELSDLAMRTGTSVDELTRSALAFKIAGLPMTVESMATALQYMEKNTGQQGLESLFVAAKKIAEIDDGAARGKKLVEMFGRAGLQLQPLVSNGAATVDKMRLLARLMPRVTDSAANAGDEIADAQEILGTGIQSLWQRTIGKICSLWGGDFPGGVRAGALNAINWVEYAMKKMYNTLTKWGAKIALDGEAMFNWLVNDYTWDQAWDERDKLSAQMEKDLEAKQKKIEADREKYLKDLRKLSVDDLANALGKKRGGGGSGVGASQRITNDLVLGGSNAARRMMILGPTFQSEMKKQTAELEKIRENTEKTAENTEDTGDNLEATDLGG